MKEKIVILLKYIGLFCIGVILSDYYFRFVNYIINRIPYDDIPRSVQSIGSLIIYIVLIFPLILILLKKISHSISYDS